MNCPSIYNLNFYDIFAFSRRSLLQFGESVKAELEIHVLCCSVSSLVATAAYISDCYMETETWTDL